MHCVTVFSICSCAPMRQSDILMDTILLKLVFINCMVMQKAILQVVCNMCLYCQYQFVVLAVGRVLNFYTGVVSLFVSVG